MAAIREYGQFMQELVQPVCLLRDMHKAVRDHGGGGIHSQDFFDLGLVRRYNLHALRYQILYELCS